MLDVVEELKAALPPIFLGSRIGDLTGGAIHWPTIQNKRALRLIPPECFCYSGRQVLVKRDAFLAWWGTTLTDTSPCFDKPEKRRGRPRCSDQEGREHAAR